ncbi:hypothetical protein D3C77_613680 [compost metagenome]
MLLRGPGSGPITAKYQKKICSSGGMLRNVSIYTVASWRISQFGDKRAMPRMKPRMVARMMPITLTSRVLSKPTQNTRA